MVCQEKNLGNNLLADNTLVDKENIKMVVELPHPIYAKGVGILMGHCGLYCRFFYMYNNAAKHLYTLLNLLECKIDCEQDFQMYIHALIVVAMLNAWNHNEVFCVHIDASAYATACISTHTHENHMNFVVSYASP